MKEVWKYQLKPGDQSIEMPAKSRILSVGVQDDGPVLWALVDHEEPGQCSYAVQIIGTGHEIRQVLPRFLGTVQFPGPFPFTNLVFHVFASEEPL